MFLLAAPAWAEDLGKLSTNPAGLSGLFGLFSLSGYLVSLVIQSANPMNETNQTNKINQFVSPFGRGLRIEGC
jgi:hypothetical protein